jgi:hypothetical protein
MSNERQAQSVTEPYPPPRTLVCPGCGRPLLYRETTIANRGSNVDRRDHYDCAGCGRFEYRVTKGLPGPRSDGGV